MLVLSDSRSAVWEDAGTPRSSVARSSIWSPRGVRSWTSRGIWASAQSIYTWVRQDRIDRGLEPGLSSAEHAELSAARRRITELETELQVARRAEELLREATTPKGGSRPSR